VDVSAVVGPSLDAVQSWNTSGALAPASDSVSGPGPRRLNIVRMTFQKFVQAFRILPRRKNPIQTSKASTQSPTAKPTALPMVQNPSVGVGEEGDVEVGNCEVGLIAVAFSPSSIRRIMLLGIPSTSKSLLGTSQQSPSSTSLLQHHLGVGELLQ
jgi:hypothetical protein